MKNIVCFICVLAPFAAQAMELTGAKIIARIAAGQRLSDQDGEAFVSGNALEALAIAKHMQTIKGMLRDQLGHDTYQKLAQLWDVDTILGLGSKIMTDNPQCPFEYTTGNLRALIGSDEITTYVTDQERITLSRVQIHAISAPEGGVGAIELLIAEPSALPYSALDAAMTHMLQAMEHVLGESIKRTAGE